MALTTTDLHGSLPLVARGKVRDIYAVPDDVSALLFVATDRISAYDVVMKNGIKDKGKLLTALSAFWFELLGGTCANHVLSTAAADFPAQAAAYMEDQLAGRSMLVRRLRVLPVEAIVRGYLTGSAWTEYERTGTVHGIRLPAGMQESEAFARPLFTPSTKAASGQHDENIHPDEVAKLVGEKHARRIEQLSIELYMAARDYAAAKGIIIADTKFEFGLNDADEVVLADEVLTPDSSRFWLASVYEPGRPQDSYDKQFLREWLTRNSLRGKEGVEIPDNIARRTRHKYVEVYELLTGRTWSE